LLLLGDGSIAGTHIPSSIVWPICLTRTGYSAAVPRPEQPVRGLLSDHRGAGCERGQGGHRRLRMHELLTETSYFSGSDLFKIVLCCFVIYFLQLADSLF
jgi:hypothetical protein